MADVRAAFNAFCNVGSAMDQQGFLNLCMACNLLGDELTFTDAVHIFTTAVPSDLVHHGMNFNQFVIALKQLAAKRNCAFSTLALQINARIQAAQPVTNLCPTPPLEPRSSPPSPASTRYSSASNTPRSCVSSALSRAENVVTMSVIEFEYICEQLRTNQLLGPPAANALEEAAGVSQNKMPSAIGNMAKGLREKMLETRNVSVPVLEKLQHELDDLHKSIMEKDKTIGNLRKQVARLNIEQKNAPSKEEENERRSSSVSLKLSQRRVSSRSQGHRRSARLERRLDCNSVGLLHEAYTSFSAGAEGINDKTFVQLCMEAHLVNKEFTSKDAHRIFGYVAKHDDYGYLGITYAQFKAALDMIAEHKHMDVSIVSDAICSIEEEQRQAVHWQS